MSSLPPDIISDIVSRLPVESLLRFKCVSKPWKSLIENPDFVKLHLHRSIHANSDLTLVTRSLGLYTIGLNSLHEPTELHHPMEAGDGAEVLGSCHGLLALYGSLDEIALFNPYTRNHRMLPPTPREFPNHAFCCDFVVFGLGFDPVTDDYKVVRIAQCFGGFNDGFESEVRVYSLKNDSWRRIKDFPYYLIYKHAHGVLAANALHWVVSKTPDSVTTRLVVAFDLVSEEHRELPLPEIGDEDFHVTVDVLGGSLCLTCNYMANYVDIWVMKEYGVKESWSRLIRITPSVLGDFDYVRPLAYSKNKDEILLLKDDIRFVWYNVRTKRAKKVRRNGLSCHCDTFVFVGSLVPLGCDRRNDGKAKPSGEESRKTKKRDDFLSTGFKLVL